MQKITIDRNIQHTHAFHSFCKDNDIRHIIGFSGGADDKLNGISSEDPLQELHKKYINELFTRIITDTLKPLQNAKITQAPL